MADECCCKLELRPINHSGAYILWIANGALHDEWIQREWWLRRCACCIHFKVLDLGMGMSCAEH